MTVLSRLPRLAIVLFLLVAGGVVNGAWSQSLSTDVTGYETVSVSITATSYDANAGGAGKGVPQMAPVKYNKLFPLVITSDDMGKTELTNNWAVFNGYPPLADWEDVSKQPWGTDFLNAPYATAHMGDRSQDVADYTPLTYTDNVGKTHRFTATSAIMPSFLTEDDNQVNYTKINAASAKTMLRTGWSFAQHDVSSVEGGVSSISSRMTTESSTWATKVGIGLKVMVEPNGNHDYLDAGKTNSGVCWNIFQNNTMEYPSNPLSLSDWITHAATGQR